MSEEGHFDQDLKDELLAGQREEGRASGQRQQPLRGQEHDAFKKRPKHNHTHTRIHRSGAGA